MADRKHLDLTKLLYGAGFHRHVTKEEYELFQEMRNYEWISDLILDFDCYVSQEHSPRISVKLIQLYDFKKFNNEFDNPYEDKEQKPVKTRNITGKAINIADCSYLAIVEIRY
ncbi:MAG: hypothetical protein EZS28_006834 [Streblomastix strix]|uniref:Uncharacterized protein n=1 Tax=Streblomastix strix TaxID=222440 RepID=A0A5J4WR81_9EUKA|nr:MAG: hypothetical protein EZS28_006834 [Streblomastix strix]